MQPRYNEKRFARDLNSAFGPYHTWKSNFHKEQDSGNAWYWWVISIVLIMVLFGLASFMVPV